MFWLYITVSYCNLSVISHTFPFSRPPVTYQGRRLSLFDPTTTTTTTATTTTTTTIGYDYQHYSRLMTMLLLLPPWCKLFRSSPDQGIRTCSKPASWTLRPDSQASDATTIVRVLPGDAQSTAHKPQFFPPLEAAKKAVGIRRPSTLCVHPNLQLETWPWHLTPN